MGVRMSVEEDIGGLKADMKTVKDQTSRIFRKMDEMHAALIKHSVEAVARLDVVEERHDTLSDYVTTQVDPHVRSYLRTRASAKGVLLAIGGIAGLVSGAFFDFLKAFWNGGV